MKKITLSIATLAMFFAVSCNQAPQVPVFDKEIAASVNSVVENAAEKSVTFSLYAPAAHEVKLTGDLASAETVLVKDAQGIWSVTVSGVEPGSYRYGFNVDGLNVIDPHFSRPNDILTMTELTFGQDMFWELKDVPHGLMTAAYYKSSTMNKVRRMHIWTPAGYNNPSKPLPVFYLQHGGGDNDLGWPIVGCAGEILDNLFAEGKIVPMVVVMPDGSISEKDYPSELVNDIMPYIEKTYNVKTGAANTALAGLSMGGIQTMATMLEYPKLFKYINVMSSGWFKNNEEAFKNYGERLKAVAGDLNSTVSLLRMTQGGPDDIAYENGHSTYELFKAAGIPYEYSEMPGGHNWYVWRYDLAYFAQQLFK